MWTVLYKLISGYFFLVKWDLWVKTKVLALRIGKTVLKQETIHVLSYPIFGGQSVKADLK